MLLDTDAVLYCLIEELPESRPLCSALRALQAEGVRLIVPRSVMNEAVGHISRAERTFRRFGGSLARMTPEMVQSEVWHAVVQGLYYADCGTTAADFHTYWSKYYDRDRPQDFVQFLLESRFVCEIHDNILVEAEDQEAADSIAQKVMQDKEPGRLYVGTTIRHWGTARLVGGSTRPDAEFVWASSNPNVATVDFFGNVTARSAGETTISASFRAHRGAVSYRVVPLPATQL
ncbi:MAG: Ig-like domain-containing protein, partial [Planctomycetes bacterium]|nr:Ig-like domain-containing protein [Planctomycetota bacterium]